MAERQDRLEERLLALASDVDFPPTPPIARSVAARISSTPRAPQSTARRGRDPIRIRLRLGLLALVAIALLGLVAAVAIATGGLRLTFVPGTPSPQRPHPGEAALGRMVLLDEARRVAGFRLVVPTLPALGSPDRIFVQTPPRGGAVTLVYDSTGGRPPSLTGASGLRVTEFRADIGPESFEKLIFSGTRVESSVAAGHPAWWVAGGDHYFVYRDAGGTRVETTLRLAGDTLIWEEGGVTFRVEGAPTLEAAQAVAASGE